MEATLRSCVERLEMQADPSSPVYFILHIPKTAGQTIQQHLAENCAPGVFWGPHQAPRLQSLYGRRYKPRSLPEAPRIRAVFGHNLGRSLEKYFPDREIRRVALLRDPISLHLSLYNHRMMLHLTKGLGTYSFDLHLKALPRDFVAHRLLARWLEIPWPTLMAMTDQQKYTVLNLALSQFWYVGSHTDCNHLVAAISSDLGLPVAARPRNTTGEWEKRTNWRPLRAADLSPATREAILANSPLDQALWEGWAGAGPNPAGDRPRPLQSRGPGLFLAHEIVRPIFNGICRYRRDGIPSPPVWACRRPEDLACRTRPRGAQMGTRRSALPGGARRHAKRARNVGPIWPCAEGIREGGGCGGSLSKIDQPRPQLRRRTSTARACPEDPGTDRRGSWRLFSFDGSRSGASSPAGRTDRARLDGGTD